MRKPGKTTTLVALTLFGGICAPGWSEAPDEPPGLNFTLTESKPVPRREVRGTTSPAPLTDLPENACQALLSRLLPSPAPTAKPVGSAQNPRVASPGNARVVWHRFPASDQKAPPTADPRPVTPAAPLEVECSLSGPTDSTRVLVESP